MEIKAALGDICILDKCSRFITYRYTFEVDPHMRLETYTITDIIYIKMLFLKKPPTRGWPFKNRVFVDILPKKWTNKQIMKFITNLPFVTEWTFGVIIIYIFVGVLRYINGQVIGSTSKFSYIFSIIIR